MSQIPLNGWAILAAAIVHMVLGFLWYGPVFGKPWMREMKISAADMKKGGMDAGMMLGSFIAALIMAFVLRHAVFYSGVEGASWGAVVGFLMWLGFVATTMVNGVFFEKKSWTLFWLNSGYYLVSMMIMAAILVSWV